jgi:hypothetical protein
MTHTDLLTDARDVAERLGDTITEDDDYTLGISLHEPYLRWTGVRLPKSELNEMWAFFTLYALGEYLKRGWLYSAHLSSEYGTFYAQEIAEHDTDENREKTRGESDTLPAAIIASLAAVARERKEKT